MNQLQVKKDNNTTEIKCFDCGKPGVKMGHEGCTQSGKKLHIPKNKYGNTRGGGNGGRGGRNRNTGHGHGRGRGGRGGQQNNNNTPPADAPKPGEAEVRMKNGVEEKIRFQVQISTMALW
jgi:hypothetical protein